MSAQPVEIKVRNLRVGDRIRSVIGRSKVYRVLSIAPAGDRTLLNIDFQREGGYGKAFMLMPKKLTTLLLPPLKRYVP